MSGKKNKSVKSLMKTMELSPEMLEAIRDTEKSGKTFPPKKMEPDKPISEKDKKNIESLKKNLKSGGTFNGRAIMKKRGGTFKGVF